MNLHCPYCNNYSLEDMDEYTHNSIHCCECGNNFTTYGYYFGKFSQIGGISTQSVKIEDIPKVITYLNQFSKDNFLDNDKESVIAKLETVLKEIELKQRKKEASRS